ncbi:MAG: creatininase family protein [Planctomycetes bacterium]|nr:creatininase family protein [Planctomycetota bacterium]
MREKRVFIQDFTRKEFRDLLSAGTIQAALVPTGTTEQHEEHLEMAHDAASAEYMAREVALRLHPRVVVAPTVTVGVSEHHMPHKGTLTVRVGTFLDYVFDICESIARAGIRNILIVNGHGGHMNCLSHEVVRYRQLTRANIVYCSYWDIYTSEEAYALMESKRLPGHAQEYETSFGLAAFPERVHWDAVTDPEAKLATAEKGRKVIAIAVDRVSDLVQRMIAGETPQVQPHSFRPAGVLVGPQHFPYQSPRTV